MTYSKHTPGPWKATCLDRSSPPKVMYWDIEPVRKDGEDYRGDIASVHASENIGGITVEERDANARLIAAAPDMLQKGKHLAVKLAEVYRAAGQSPKDCQAIREWMEAVANAEGRS